MQVSARASIAAGVSDSFRRPDHESDDTDEDTDDSAEHGRPLSKKPKGLTPSDQNGSKACLHTFFPVNNSYTARTLRASAYPVRSATVKVSPTVHT